MDCMVAVPFVAALLLVLVSGNRLMPTTGAMMVLVVMFCFHRLLGLLPGLFLDFVRTLCHM